MAESLFGSQCSKKEKNDEVSLQKQSQMERFERIFDKIKERSNKKVERMLNFFSNQ